MAKEWWEEKVESVSTLERFGVLYEEALKEIDRLRARNETLIAALENMGRDCKACGRWHMTGCNHYFACEGPDVCDPRCLIAQAAITAEKGE